MSISPLNQNPAAQPLFQPVTADAATKIRSGITGEDLDYNVNEIANAVLGKGSKSLENGIEAIKDLKTAKVMYYKGGKDIVNLVRRIAGTFSKKFGAIHKTDIVLASILAAKSTAMRAEFEPTTVTGAIAKDLIPNFRRNEDEMKVETPIAEAEYEVNEE